MAHMIVPVRRRVSVASRVRRRWSRHMWTGATEARFTRRARARTRPGAEALQVDAQRALHARQGERARLLAGLVDLDAHARQAGTDRLELHDVAVGVLLDAAPAKRHPLLAGLRRRHQLVQKAVPVRAGGGDGLGTSVLSRMVATATPPHLIVMTLICPPAARLSPVARRNGLSARRARRRALSRRARRAARSSPCPATGSSRRALGAPLAAAPALGPGSEAGPAYGPSANQCSRCSKR